MSSFGQPHSQDVKIKVNHVAISVTDLEESEVFYRDIIGLKQIPEPFGVGRHAWFDIGGTQLHVIKSSDQRTEHIMQNHICLSVHDLDEFANVLTNNGVKYMDLDGNEGQMNHRPDGVRQIYLTDPDGYWLEINDEY
ncbi:MAG: VOC family protein [Balneolales bacterium]